MQSRNAMAERLPERPILGFYENERNVTHSTFWHCRVCTLILVNLFRNVTGTTYVFGCLEIGRSLTGKVSQVVLQAMLNTGTAFKIHSSNGFLHLEMVINNFPAYLFAVPYTFLLF